MAEIDSSVADGSRSEATRSSCRRLLVVDPAGLLDAPLDAVDVELVDVDELLSSLDEGAGTPPLGAAAPPDVTSAAGTDQLGPVTPTVLRQQDAHVLAWHDLAGGYVALGAAHLAVLDQARYPMAVEHLVDRIVDSPWRIGRDEVGTAVAQLGALGLVELEGSPVEDSPPTASPIEPDASTVEAELDAERPVDEVEPHDGPAVEDVASAHGAGGVDEEHDAAGVAGPEQLPGLLEDLPGGSEGARVLAYRVIGRSRRRARRAWIAAGRAGARRMLAHFGTVEDDWPTAPEPQADLQDPQVADTDDEALEAAADPGPEVTADGQVPSPDGPTAVDAVETGEEPPVEPGPAVEEVAALEHLVSAEHHEDTDVAPVHDHRTPVFGVYYSPEHNANLGLGMIIAHARVVDRGALNNAFDLRRASIDAEPMLEELERTGRPAIVLCSDYMWSIDHNLAVSERVKQLSPSSLVVHGGPHAPKYEADAERFLDEHPYVDVLVRGEGELTVADLLRAVGPDPDPDRLGEVLSEVEGLTFRSGPHGSHTVLRTPDRPRPAEMDQFPSPYLTGEFDEIDTERWRSATVETNRGCPYGCTFCDWGTATNSRIRQFDRDRVFAELEWLASRGISEIFLADANFGLFARDVEVAQHIAELKQRYGAPMQVICSFAKNTVKYTSEIVQIWVEAGICAEGSVALQTTDEVTLANVERSNIKVEKYDALAEEFRRHRLPIVTDLLMGLPGATVESFKNDLQRCLDQEVTPRMMETVLLPNSPMNAPEYRERFRIETDDANVLVATSSYTREDFEEMKRLRLLFRACEHYGLLRHLFRWLQVEKGVRALDLVHDIDRAIDEDPSRYPLLTWVGRYFDLITAPPGGWPPFYDEVVDLLSHRHGIERDEAMDTVLAVQQFLMPNHHRRFPDRLELAHDYVAWYRATSFGADGRGQVPALASMPPGELVVDDPAGVCDARMLRNGFSIRREEACDNPFWVLNDWELESELARPMATAVPLLSTS